MVSLPWYVGWNKQKAAHRARARLNGTIAKWAQDCGACIMPHPGIQVVQGKGLYDIHHLGSLSVMGNLVFMSNVVNKIKKIKYPFKAAWQKQQLPHKMFAVTTNKSLESRICSSRHPQITCVNVKCSRGYPSLVLYLFHGKSCLILYLQIH